MEEEAAGRAKPPRPGAPTVAADSVKLFERGVGEKGSIVEPQTAVTKDPSIKDDPKTPTITPQTPISTFVASRETLNTEHFDPVRK